jgi:hypothetical protein
MGSTSYENKYPNIFFDFCPRACKCFQWVITAGIGSNGSSGNSYWRTGEP